MPSEDSKPAVRRVKPEEEEEEEEEEDDQKSLGSILKAKNGGRAAVSASKGAGICGDSSSEKKPARGGSAAGDRVAKVKREAKVEEDNSDDEPIGKRASGVKNDKELNKKKRIKEEPEKKMAKQAVENGKTRVKKVYDLPGQKRDPPEERDPLRIFYETLHKQIPNSEMAQFWMMESGLLPKELAKKIFEKKQKRSQAQRLNSPAKSSAAPMKRCSQTTATVKKSNPSPSNKKTTEPKASAHQVKKRKDQDRGSDDDFVLASKVSKRQRAA